MLDEKKIFIGQRFGRIFSFFCRMFCARTQINAPATGLEPTSRDGSDCTIVKRSPVRRVTAGCLIDIYNLTYPSLHQLSHLVTDPGMLDGVPTLG